MFEGTNFRPQWRKLAVINARMLDVNRTITAVLRHLRLLAGRAGQAFFPVLQAAPCAAAALPTCWAMSDEPPPPNGGRRDEVKTMGFPARPGTDRRRKRDGAEDNRPQLAKRLSLKPKTVPAPPELKRDDDLRLFVRPLDQLGEGVMLIDADGVIAYSNPVLRRIFNIPASPDGRHFDEVFGRNAVQGKAIYCERFYHYALHADHPFSSELLIQGKKESEAYYALFLDWPLGGGVYTLCVLKKIGDLGSYDEDSLPPDMAGESALYKQNRELMRLNAQLRIENAERTSVAQALRRAESRYRDIFDNATEGIVQWTPDWRLISANMSFARMMGFSTVNALLATVAENAFHFCYSPLVEKELVAELERKEQIHDFNFQIVRHDGTQVWASMNARKVSGPDGSTSYYEAFIENITVRKLAEEKLVYQAFHDPLTGLANRALFHDRLRMALRRASRQPAYSFAILYLDLDRFKIVNDSFGHNTGDDVLCHAAVSILSCVREVDTVARFGGDEFAILIDDMRGGSMAVSLAKRIHGVLSQPFKINNQEISIGASIGIVLNAEQYELPEEILRDADTAMYQAKADRGVCFKIFSQTMRQVTMESVVFETDLRQGLKNEEFYMAYQPILDMQSNRLYGFEALMRWNRRGVAVGPAYFIAVAEETGLIGPLGLFMIEQVCRQVAHWKSQFGGDFVTHVNISGRQLINPSFAGDVESVLERTGTDPSNLLFEITESVLMDRGGACIQGIKQLRNLGIKFCLDDFGTGFSSLSYLRQLPISSIKIDRSFVTDVETDPHSLVILRNLLSLGQDLQLDVIVEGIERNSQKESLLSTGCRLGQGFYFHRPMTSENASELLHKLRYRGVVSRNA